MRKLHIIIILLFLGSIYTSIKAQTTLGTITNASNSCSFSTTVCEGDTITLIPTDLVNYTNIRWYFSSVVPANEITGINPTAHVISVSGSTVRIVQPGGTYILTANYSTPSGCVTKNDTIVINFSPKPNLVITNPPTTCLPTTVNLTHSSITTGSTLNGGSLSYWTDASAQTTLSNPSTITTSGIYYIKATTALGCSDIKPVSVNMASTPTVSISGTDTVCSGGTTTLSASINGGNGTANYQWQQNVSGSWINIASNNPIFITPALYSDKEYRVIITQSGNSCNATSDVFTVNIASPLSVSLTIDNAAVCLNGTATFSANVAGGAGVMTYEWQNSTNNTTWADISTTATTSYSPPTNSVGTLYYRLKISASGSGCNFTTSSSTAFGVRADPSFSTQPVGFTECIGGNQVLSTIGNGGITLTYQWQRSSDNTTWIDLAGETGANFTPPSNSVHLMYYRARMMSSGSGCDANTSTVATVRVVSDPIVNITSSNNSVCQGASITLNANLIDNSNTCSLQWQSSTNGILWTNIPGQNSTTFNAPGLNNTTKYRVILNCSGDGCCN